MSRELIPQKIMDDALRAVESETKRVEKFLTPKEADLLIEKIQSYQFKGREKGSEWSDAYEDLKALVNLLPQNGNYYEELKKVKRFFLQIYQEHKIIKLSHTIREAIYKTMSHEPKTKADSRLDTVLRAFCEKMKQLKNHYMFLSYSDFWEKTL